MKSPNPSMSDEDWRFAELFSAAFKFLPEQKADVEVKLDEAPDDIDIRVQLLSYHNRRTSNKLEHPDADRKLSEQAMWFINNKPDLHLEFRFGDHDLDWSNDRRDHYAVHGNPAFQWELWQFDICPE